MSTAYAPRVTAGPVGPFDVTGSDETLVSSIPGGPTTNVQVDLWVHALVVAAAGADTTTVTLTAYLGPFADGISIGSVTYVNPDFDGQNIPVTLDVTVEIGEGVAFNQIDVTVQYVDASADGGGTCKAAVLTVF